MNDLPELRFDFKAILRLEENGLNLLDGDTLEANLTSPKNIALLFWGGSLHECPDMTKEEAVEIMNSMPLAKLFPYLTGKLKKDMQASDDSEAGDTPTAG